ncbi:MAG: hypothetical protein LAT57_05505 [Balneolales bacterium]|nr:hypothetical protein [Balneolales bacterium]
MMIFVSDSASTTTGKVIANISDIDFDEDNFGSYTFEYVPDFTMSNDSLYFYAIIKDGINPPLKSNLNNLGFENSAKIRFKLTYPGESTIH